jgi:hypothetical protein
MEILASFEKPPTPAETTDHAAGSSRDDGGASTDVIVLAAGPAPIPENEAPACDQHRDP